MAKPYIACKVNNFNLGIYFIRLVKSMGFNFTFKENILKVLFFLFFASRNVNHFNNRLH